MKVFNRIVNSHIVLAKTRVSWHEQFEVELNEIFEKFIEECDYLLHSQPDLKTQKGFRKKYIDTENLAKLKQRILE